MDSLLYTNYNGVPLLTYGLIGVTSIVLAYVTITDTGTKNSTTEVSSAPPAIESPPMSEEEELEGELSPLSEPEIRGGNKRKKNHKKNAKTKRGNRK